MTRCACGCGQEIIEKKYQFIRNYNPKFIQGHNVRKSPYIPPHKCLICDNMTTNLKYCSKKCNGLGSRVKLKKIHCKFCNKMLEIGETSNQIYCNKKCFVDDIRANGQSWVEKRVQSVINNGKLKGRKIWNDGLTKETDERVKKLAKNISKSMKNNPKCREATSRSMKKLWKNELYRKIQLDKILNGKNPNRHIKVLGCRFDSKGEAEIALNLFYQFNINIIEKVNLHFLLGLKEYDFKIKEFKCFIEYHPQNNYFGSNKVNLKKYYMNRRKNLDVGGYKDYSLLIIK